MTLDRDLVAEVLPRYEVRQEIGRGGWGVVYEGWHRDLKRPVAIKQLTRAFGSDGSVRDRFVAEAQLVARLEHPHIVRVFDFAERDGLYVIVMELASGSAWQRFVETGMRTDEAVGTVLATAIGLHHAHQHDMLHRDVKPDNVLYSASGMAMIADFGIAKSLSETGKGHTATNALIGSPAYMAPEQVTGAQLSPATDVYALGVVLYQLLSGELPFAPVSDSIAQLFQHVHETPRELTGVAPAVPSQLARVAHRALQKQPADRPQSAEDFAIELAEAATSAFGIGWLDRAGLAVMGSGPVIAATHRAPTSSAGSPRETIVVRPQAIERHRLGPLEPALEASADLAADSPPSEHDRTSAAGDEPDAEDKRRAWLPAAAAAVLAAVLAVVALVVFGGGGDRTAQIDTEPAEISAAEQAAFASMCEANGVADARCRSALSRSIDGLDADVFRANLEVMVQQDGALGPELTSMFESCVADGF